MPNTSSIIHRAKQQKKQNMQDGTIISFTTVRHPPVSFGSKARLLALIELEDQSRVIAPVDVSSSVTLSIGQAVSPHRRFSRVNEQGLRVYEVVYAVTNAVSSTKKKPFPGYIIALTGPSGVGRTTIAGVVATAFKELTEVVPMVTCQKSHQYKYCKTISKKVFSNLCRNGDMIVSSDTSFLGYRTSDIAAVWKRGKVPIVVTEETLLQELVHAYGRRSVVSFGLLPPGKSKRTMLSHLLHRMRQSSRYPEECISQHLQKAEGVLKFVKKQTQLFETVIVHEDTDGALDTLSTHLKTLDPFSGRQLEG